MTKKIEVKLDGLSVGGEAVGSIVSAADSTLIGMRGFIRFGIPGETVVAEDFEAKKGFFRASLGKVVESSSERQKPECQYFGVCGGCDLQHINYSAQLASKKRMLVDALRAGRVSETTFGKVQNIVPSKPFAYRKRVTLHIDQEGKVGFYHRGTRSVVPVSSCIVCDERISGILGKLSAPKDNPATMYLELEEEKIFCLVRYPEEVSQKTIMQLEGALSPLLDGGRIASRRKAIHTFGVAPKSTGSFSQINPEINNKLVAAVVEEVRSRGARKIEDLYSGAGNFAFPLANAGCEVIAVESDASLCEVAKNKAKSNVTFFNQTVEQYLKVRKDSAIDLVLADPPRSGLGPLVNKFNYTKNLILISCHLPSCVRDLKAFEDLGWKIEKILPFDMFPQTSYLEVMTVLSAPSFSSL